MLFQIVYINFYSAMEMLFIVPSNELIDLLVDLQNNPRTVLSDNVVNTSKF